MTPGFDAQVLSARW